MIVRTIPSQTEFCAYVMHSSEYKDGHPDYHPFCLHERDKNYLVIACNRTQEVSSAWDRDVVIIPRNASNYILMEATDAEKQALIESGYKMIGLL